MQQYEPSDLTKRIEYFLSFKFAPEPLTFFDSVTVGLAKRVYSDNLSTTELAKELPGICQVLQLSAAAGIDPAIAPVAQCSGTEQALANLVEAAVQYNKAVKANA